MKKIASLFLLLLIAGLNSFSQKKSGVIYSEHESISKTRELWKAAVNGDEAKYQSFFADSAYIVRNSNNPPLIANEQIGKGLAEWSNSYENLKIEDQKPGFPDALEYKEGGIWVQDWLLLSGIHKETGIVLDLPIHNLYSFNEDGKITMMASYFDNDVFEEIVNSRTTRENGTVYINHPYIVTVRKAINAFASGDFETWAGYFSPEARFTTSSMKSGESMSLEEYKQTLIDMFFKDDMKFKVEQVGYPDCVYYAQNDLYVVYSWWKMTVKKDGKISEIPFMLSHDFNDEGKINFARIYMSSNHLENL
jgi:hypothetical protein